MIDTIEKPATGEENKTSPDILPTYKRAPMRFVRGAGVELFDEEGKAYLDLSSGIAVNAFGYGDAGIRETIESVLSTGVIHVSNLYRTDAGER
ncbi:MAG: hypothetical protein ACRD3J_17720, partial [Thermoanaerobaculia bacterium]